MRSLATIGFVMSLAASPVMADVVFQNSNDNGYFVPFDSNTPSSIRYGDGGWLSGFQPQNFTLVSIDLGLAVFSAANAGTADLTFTFNDGDPSGLVFGSGGALYSTTIQDVALPATAPGMPAFFSLTIPLPNVQTLGGFNNVGFSVGVSDFQYEGSFGFQCSSALGQSVGFYTNNASFYDGVGWSLFAFSGDPTFGVANFVVTMRTPEPASLTLLGLASLFAARRRR